MGNPKTMGSILKWSNDLDDWGYPNDLGTPQMTFAGQSTEAMRCLAGMETVGQCYASTIAGELASQDPESRAAACDLVVMLCKPGR